MIMFNKRGLCQWEIDLEFLRVDSKISCVFHSALLSFNLLFGAQILPCPCMTLMKCPY